MKKILRTMLIASVLSWGLLTTLHVTAQAPPPPEPPGSHGSGANQGPMGAPIDGGMAIFLAFAAGYAGREWHKRSKKNLVN